jgi:Rha family phage regulatory protein
MNDRVSEELLAEAAAQHADVVLARVQAPTLNFLDFIDAHGEDLTTDSQKVAAVFGKSHDNLLKRIRSIASQLPTDRLGYFDETVSSRENPSGGGTIESPSFQISKDGFVLLVMGFTGRRALAYKLAYIDAFNAMAAYIKNQREGLQYRFLETELKFNNEKEKASNGGRVLRQWQKTKPQLKGEMDKLQVQMQPSLDFPTGGAVE